MSLFSRKIHVTFVDARTGKVFAQSKLPADSFPESFHLETTLHIGDEDWSVVEAEPQTRAEYSKTKKLTLRLLRIEFAPFDDIIFSLPSICDTLPPLCETPRGASDLLLNEDDWRQLELVSRAKYAAIELQFAAIRQIHEEQSVEGGGWREVHIRTEPSPAITSDLHMDDIRRAFDGIGRLAGLAFGRPGSTAETHLVADGFSVSCNDGLSIYGVAPSGRVDTLGVVETHHESTPGCSMSALVELADVYALDLVQWCRCQQESPTIPGFRKLIMWGCETDGT